MIIITIGGEDVGRVFNRALITPVNDYSDSYEMQ